MLAMDNARRAMDAIVSDLRIKRAPSSKTPPGAMRAFHPGELVRVYCERPDMWTGLSMCVTVLTKILFL
jgi:hypothetical protein